MINKLKKMTCVFFLLATSSLASAELITWNEYTLDDTTNIVSGGGLEWLQWDQNLVTSINMIEASPLVTVDGWRLATNIEMARLFNHFAFSAPFVWSDEESIGQIVTHDDEPQEYDFGNCQNYYCYVDVEDINNDPELQFISLFGATEIWGGGYMGVQALYGSDSDADNLYKLANVYDDGFTFSRLWNNGYASLSADSISDDWIFTPTSIDDFPVIGIALVRAIETPEPTIVVLFGLGLIFTLGVRTARP